MPSGEESQIRRTARISITEGIFAQVYSSLAAPGSVFITRFAVMLGAAPFHFAVISAIGQLAQLFQPFGALITRRKRYRKNSVITLNAIGRSLTFFYGFLPFLFAPKVALWIFISMFFVATTLQAMGGNIWIAWISDIIPTRIRGRFFSRRAQYLFFTGMLTGYVFSFLIDLFQPDRGVISGTAAKILDNPAVLSPHNLKYVFLFLFAFASAVGLYGLRILRTQPEKRKEIEHSRMFGYLVDPLKDKNFRKLLIYALWWMFAVGIGAPFWQPFMIKKLGMSMTEIQIYGTINVVSSILSLKFWGEIIDNFGNKNAMRLAVILGGLNPMIWLFAKPHRYWMLFFEAASAGAMWAGAGVVAVNFVLAVAPREKQQIYSGIFNAFSGIGMMTTMLLSGLVIPEDPGTTWLNLQPEQVLFALTGILRWTTQIPLSWIDEPHQKPFGDALVYMRQFAKVRIVKLMGFSWVRNFVKNGLGNGKTKSHKRRS